MDTDDLEPPAKKVEQKDLVVMSIDALHEYIAELESEIARVRTAIGGKQGAREGAEKFFKS